MHHHTATFLNRTAHWSSDDRSMVLLVLHLAEATGTYPRSVVEVLRLIGGTKIQAAGMVVTMQRPEPTQWWDAHLALRDKRSRAAKGSTPAPAPEAPVKAPKPPPKVKRLSHLTEAVEPYFLAAKQGWPRNAEGGNAVGSTAKAELCWMKTIREGYATAQELAECAALYREHPNVKKGFVQMMATFFNTEQGLWREGLSKIRFNKKQREANE